MKIAHLALFVLAGALALAGSATAQTAPNTLARIKAAKAINVAYSADSLPFSFAGPDKERRATRSTCASALSRRSARR
jgi:ABC-type amino acid transport substrate-binding protein